MKKALIIIGSIVGLIVIALLVVPLLIPVETYKSELLTQIEKNTGRQARIDGDFSFSLLPRVAFTAGGVSLANAAGAKAPTMVRLDRLDVRVAVLPLLDGKLVIDSFVLEKPVIDLEVDRQGRPNWEFTTAARPGTAAPAPGPKPAGEPGFGLAGLQLGDVRLVDGTVRYSDARNGKAYALDAINMSVSLPSLTSPMTADGSLVWNSEKVALKLKAENPDAFLKGKATSLAASISSTPVNLDFKGAASSGKQFTASGALDLDVPSVRKLAAWGGQPLDAPGDGFGPLKIAGQVAVDGQKYSFTQARLNFDKIEAKGGFRFDGSGNRPYLNARLDTGVVDVNPYLPPEQATAGGKGQTATAPVAGKAAPQDWNNDPIDLSGLRQANLDAVLTVAGLQVRKIKIGKSQVALKLKDGRLAADLTEMALYNGNGKATIVADGSAATPAVNAAFNLSGVQANPVLTDAMDLDRIEGTLNTELDVTARGNSQRAMVSSLSGSGKVKFADGAIRGVNLGAMIRNVQSAFLDPAARAQQKTDFAELSGTFRIANGILRNDDLAMLSPLLRIGGKGTVDLPRKTVDYRIEPKVAATAKGQGGATDVAGVMVPVIVSGPWHALTYRPDLTGMIGDAMKDPSKAVEGLKKIIPGADKSGGAGKALPDPAGTLKNLFGR